MEWPEWKRLHDRERQAQRERLGFWNLILNPSIIWAVSMVTLLLWHHQYVNSFHLISPALRLNKIYAKLDLEEGEQKLCELVYVCQWEEVGGGGGKEGV